MLERLRSLAPESEVLAALHGHWLYSRGRAIEAIEAWSIAGDDPVSLRNRGVAAFNHLKDTAESVRCYERALSLAPADPRLWYERDQLAKQVGEPLADRLARLESHRDMVDARDDLSVEFVALLLGVGRSREALAVLKERCFQPWEGGEGQVLAVWERANCALAREAISSGDPATGVAFVQAAFQPPVSLGEDRHLLANVAHLDLLLGDALEAAGDVASARKSWQKAASAEGDFVAMSTTAHSERSAFSIIALQRLGRTGEAAELADEVTRWAEAERRAEAQIDYFATSLPTLLLFHEDPQVRQQLTCDVMRAQARLTLGDRDGAEQLLDEVLSVDPSEPFALEARALVGN
jgi:tetratricopeptide (TPR) repeat protein